MKNLEEQCYRTLFPNSIVSNNSLSYKETNDGLKTFLKNSFTNDISNFFLIINFQLKYQIYKVKKKH